MGEISMVERVAAAIHDDWQNAGAGPNNRHWSETCESLPGMANAFRKHARAAIEAMREPTEAMINAAPASYSASFREIWPKICADIYRAMIDAALSANHGAKAERG